MYEFYSTWDFSETPIFLPSLTQRTKSSSEFLINFELFRTGTLFQILRNKNSEKATLKKRINLNFRTDSILYLCFVSTAFEHLLCYFNCVVLITLHDSSICPFVFGYFVPVIQRRILFMWR